MKKLIAIFLAAILLFGLCACGNNAQRSPEKPVGTPEQVEEIAAEEDNKERSETETPALLDPEVSLWREGFDQPAGIGSVVSFFDESDCQEEILEGWEPIYRQGDYWSRRRWEDFSALCYNFGEDPENIAAGSYSIYTIDTTRTDLQTPRGIHVGSSREELLSAYPELFEPPYWIDTEPDFPGQDYLWYCENPEGFGAAILFFFVDDNVSQIRLNNMFN